MAPGRDVNQFKQACREVGIKEKQRDRAADDFHAEKQASGERGHWSYGNLIIWLRDWKEDRWQS
jgi:hypothetical protein